MRYSCSDGNDVSVCCYDEWRRGLVEDAKLNFFGIVMEDAKRFQLKRGVGKGSCQSEYEMSSRGWKGGGTNCRYPSRSGGGEGRRRNRNGESCKVSGVWRGGGVKRHE